MAVQSIYELADQRGGANDATGGRTYTRRFRVICSAYSDGPNVVKAALGIRYGDRYQAAGIVSDFADLYSYVQSIDAAQEEGDSLGWIVTVSYGPFDSRTAGGGPDNNPLLVPIDVEWSFRNQEVICQYDNNGNKIVNTANDPFDPPIMIDDPRPLLTIVRNEATFNTPVMYSYRTAVNSDPFAGFPPQMARMIQLSGKSVFHYYCGWYWQVRYEIEFNPPIGYRPLILNQGLRKLSQTTGQPVPIILNGTPVSQPMLLTKAGYLAKPTDAAYFIQPQIYPELPFAYFNFDPISINGTRSGFNTNYTSVGPQPPTPGEGS